MGWKKRSQDRFLIIMQHAHAVARYYFICSHSTGALLFYGLTLKESTSYKHSRYYVTSLLYISIHILYVASLKLCRLHHQLTNFIKMFICHNIIMYNINKQTAVQSLINC